MARAQTLKGNVLNETLLNQMPQNSTVNIISEQLIELTEKINLLSFTNKTKGSPSANNNKDFEERSSNKFSPQCLKKYCKTRYPYRPNPNKTDFLLELI